MGMNNEMEKREVHPSAVVDSTARVGVGCRIGPCAVVEGGATLGRDVVLEAGAFVGRDVSLGDGCHIGTHAVVMSGCTLGRGVVVKANAVLGADGFGYVFDGESHVKIPQVGRVIIDDGAVIGAGACVDRATSGETRIGSRAQVGNLVMVAHNCRVGAGTVIGDQTGLAGTSTIGTNCKLGMQCGVAMRGGLDDGCQLVDRGGVIKRYGPGEILAGVPARPIAEMRRIEACLAMLPALMKTLEVKGMSEGQESPRVGRLGE